MPIANVTMTYWFERYESCLNYWIRNVIRILRHIYYNVKFPDMKYTHGHAINKSGHVIRANSTALFPIKPWLVWKLPPHSHRIYMYANNANSRLRMWALSRVMRDGNLKLVWKPNPWDLAAQADPRLADRTLKADFCFLRDQITR